jgi:hypothetical protein
MSDRILALAIVGLILLACASLYWLRLEAGEIVSAVVGAIAGAMSTRVLYRPEVPRAP